MIVRQEGDHLVLIRQPDHAYLSGELAAVWGNPPWEVVDPHPSVVAGARQHDEAWLLWDESPTVGPDGRPLSFFQVDRVTTADMYRRGADAVCVLDLYAGLMVSLHYSGFFHGHWDWQPFSTPDNFPDPERTALRQFVDGELRRQDDLRRQLDFGDVDETRLAANFKWLQLWDRISLDVCRRDPDEPWSVDYPDVPLTASADAGRASLRLSMPHAGEYLLDPYPLRRAPYHARLATVRMPLEALGDQATFLERWRQAQPEHAEITFGPS